MRFFMVKVRLVWIVFVLGIMTFFHDNVSAEYSVNISAVRYKGDFFEGFQSQRSLLFFIGFPGAETNIRQTLDSAIDSYQITAGYHLNKYHSFKVSYLGKSDYSLRSQFLYRVPLASGIREINGNDEIKAKVRGSSIALYSELPIRENIAVGSNLGILASRTVVSRTISGLVVEDGLTDRQIESSLTKTKYEVNPLIGLYVYYKYSVDWRLLFQWNRYFNVGEQSVFPGVVDLSGDVIDIKMDNEVHVDSYSLGLEYRF